MRWKQQHSNKLLKIKITHISKWFVATLDNASLRNKNCCQWLKGRSIASTAAQKSIDHVLSSTVNKMLSKVESCLDRYSRLNRECIIEKKSSMHMGKKLWAKPRLTGKVCWFMRARFVWIRLSVSENVIEILQLTISLVKFPFNVKQNSKI